MFNESTLSPVEELCKRLANNPLEDDYDKLNHVQYAARLAALGDDSFLQKVTVTAEMLKNRCIRGIREIMEYEGDDLALSIIDAQDFSLFENRTNETFSDIKHCFAEWRDVCEDVPLDDEAADLLRGFAAIYHIPADELLPVIARPISKTEYAMLHEIYKDVHVPVYELHWKQNYATKEQIRQDWELAGKIGTPKLTWIAAADDGKPVAPQQDMIKSNDNEVKTKKGTVRISRMLRENWDLCIRIEGDHQFAIDSIRLGGVPAFRDKIKSTDWNIALKMLPLKERLRLLDEEPLVVHFLDCDIRALPPQ